MNEITNVFYTFFRTGCTLKICNHNIIDTTLFKLCTYTVYF